jgi:UDPglucose 6-dehydrogenase
MLRGDYMKILIAGYGFVGREISKLFGDANVYDPKLYCTDHDGEWNEILQASYDFCFVCVPTPSKEDGSCDTSIVEDVVNRIDADIFIIRSTIPPGTTEKLGKNCVFTPEYVASSSPYPAPLGDIKKRDFHILGGEKEATKKVRKLFETVYPPTVTFMETDSLTAEIIKYGENFYISTKVTFCNEFYKICQKFGVDYDTFREGVFKLDPRMTEWWTYCEGKGWGGHCLPKDTMAIVKCCEDAGYDPKFLKAVIENNERHKSTNGRISI